ncbi:MAG: SPASM domain-containing protein [Acidobacteriota bacterium]|nr:SPASM domain-containing protein [Acidobacteriota bacterium]
MNRPDDLGASKFPLCREPWESYYILRRGILPCCYGNPILAPMSDYAESWNSSRLQEIRAYLARGELSPYCLESLGCPIVQRILEKKRREGEPSPFLPNRPAVIRMINRMLFGLPKRLYLAVRRERGR